MKNPDQLARVVADPEGLSAAAAEEGVRWSPPVPLLPPDGDLIVDLAAPFAESYHRGRYWKLVDYALAPPPPLFAGADADWVTQTARAGVKSS